MQQKQIHVYKYLEPVITIYKCNHQKEIDRRMTAYGKLKCVLKIKILLKLKITMVLPIIRYSYEVWILDK